MSRHLKADVLKELPTKTRQKIFLEPVQADVEKMTEVRRRVNVDFGAQVCAGSDIFCNPGLLAAVKQTFKATAEAKGLEFVG